ncbi:MAG: hypothetical protein JWN69_1881, partial [Alphaproteobacteria bacterium]|nr:hypothetical protein [Alphaproteobacteria bacterium]
RTLSLCAAQPLIERSKSPGSAYLWGRESPLHVLQRTAPERLRAEEAAIIRRTIAERPADVLRMALRGWAGQLTSAASGDGMEAYPPESSIAIVMRRHFISSGAAWTASLQQRGELRALVSPLDRLAPLLVALASPVILFAALRRRDTWLAAFVIMVITAIVVNAAVCGILAGVVDRYQARVTWLLPLLALVAFHRLRSGRARARPEPLASVATG